MRDKFIKNKNISEYTKLKVFKTVFRPIVTYGCETWVLDARQKSRIQAMEMLYFRAVCGVTRRDRIRNDEIRKRLRIIPTWSFIEQRQLSWWGHLNRMSNKRQTRGIWEARIAGNKKRGRPGLTFNSVIQGILRERGTCWNEARIMARNRKEWAKFVYEN